LPPLKGVIKVEIQSASGRGFQTVSIPGVLEYEIWSPSGSRATEPDPRVGRYLYSWLRDPQQWLVRTLTLTLDEGRIVFKGTNAIASMLFYSGQASRDQAAKLGTARPVLGYSPSVSAMPLVPINASFERLPIFHTCGAEVTR
jgi:hypothetical protein